MVATTRMRPPYRVQANTSTPNECRIRQRAVAPYVPPAAANTVLHGVVREHLTRPSAIAHPTPAFTRSRHEQRTEQPHLGDDRRHESTVSAERAPGRRRGEVGREVGHQVSDLLRSNDATEQ